MKFFHFITALGLLCFISASRCVAEQDVFTYTPYLWADETMPAACIVNGSWPDSGCFSHGYAYGELAEFGYPYHGTLCVGLNDTVHVWMVMNNRTDLPYELTGKKFETWYAPRVFPLYAVDQSVPTVRDSTELGFRVRGWYDHYGNRTETPDKINAGCDGCLTLMLDIWNLPQGHFQTCVVPTADVPSDFVAIPTGFTYTYYPPQSLADSSNAYEGNFWWAVRDSNLAAAQAWIDTIFAINPHSVPASWMKARLSWMSRDTLETVKALKDALDFLSTAADPALPDSTKRPLTEIELIYLDFLHETIQENLNELGQ